MIFIVMELFTSFRRYPSRKLGLAGLGIFMAAYLGKLIQLWKEYMLW